MHLMRSVKNILRRWNAGLIDTAGAALSDVPSCEGWVELYRTALGMSITDLAERVGVSRAYISKLETQEKSGSVNIKQIDKVAHAMGGKLVYAIVPIEGTVEDIVMTQAREKATRMVKRVRAQMTLDAISEGLPSEAVTIEELAEDLAREMARDFWK
ncbi:hypothetical protein NBRC116589_43680 [Ruegeria sp. HU-ET01832]|uniref:helix-turn-helix domain-containing protein n=1 Tax=Ruegeria sp. HU-ET01832 TaxID=3135906 RepID=UPI00310377C8